MRALSFAWLLPFALACTSVAANDSATETAKFTLKSAPRIEAAPQASARYTVNARFAREESAGELREGGGFALIGRFAKVGQSCDFTQIFRDGFESG